MNKRIFYAALWTAVLVCPTAGVAEPTPLVFEPAPELLGDPPRIPRLFEVPAPKGRAYAAPATGWVMDTANREAVRVFYNGLYAQSENVPINWTGAHTACNAGSTDPLYQDGVALRINWFRAMAGVPAAVSLDASFNLQNQQAALVMSANNALSHTPPSTWNCWSQSAYDAAGQSNLSLGAIGPDAVNGYIRDPGSSNYPLGHRRWILYPQTQNMGTGDVPAGTYNTTSVSGANALRVIDSHYGASRPTVRDDFVAWPPKGYVPYQAVYGRWSLSHSSADFTHANVSVRKAGVNVPVVLEALSNPAYGENTVAWLLQGVTDRTVWTKPASDETYAVTIANVMLSGVARTFNYDVTVIDPDTPTPNAAQTTVSVPNTVLSNTPFTATIASPMPDATAYELALYRLSSLPGVITPSLTPSPWTYVTGPLNPYNPVQTTAFHLYHADPATQLLTLNKKLYIGQNAQLSFVSWFTHATSDEVAQAQISLDDGITWQDVYTQAGSNQTSQATTTVDLAAYAGRLARLRFAFSFSSGRFYDQSTSGWFFNDIVLTNIDEMLDGHTVAVPASEPSYSFMASTAGAYVVAARTEYQGSYFSDWGLARLLQLNVSSAKTSQTIGTISFLAASVPVGGTTTVSAVATSGLTVAFSSATPGICSVTGPVVTGIAAGTCIIAADQAGNATYLAAPQVTQGIAVIAASTGTLITRYRLYSEGTKEHLYTTDANEYRVLPVCCGWLAEGAIYKLFQGAGSLVGVAAVPYYRLYNPLSYQHHWTTDLNEYNVLGTRGWSKEGVDGYILPTAVAGSVPLYRLYLNAYGGLHLWTTDANEKNVLSTSNGWLDEGVAGYVLPLP